MKHRVAIILVHDECGIALIVSSRSRNNHHQ